jgi:hypothetical protein
MVLVDVVNLKCLFLGFQVSMITFEEEYKGVECLKDAMMFGILGNVRN